MTAEEPGKPSPEPTPRMSAGMRLIAEYLQFRYTHAVVEFYAHIRRLPRPESTLAWAAVGLTALLVVATPVLTASASRMAGVSFEDAVGRMQSIPAVALALVYAAFAIAWGFVLAGTVQGPALVWILTALAYVYLVVEIGFAAGRSYLHLLILLLPIIISAATANGRAWGKFALLAVLASLTVRITPLPLAVRARWWLWWIPAALVLLGLHRLVAHRPWRDAATRVWVASAVTVLYFLGIAAVRGGRGQMATGLNLAINSALGPLEALWFVLGASFVTGAIALGRLGTKMVEIAAPPQRLTWLLLAGWAGLAAWVLYGAAQTTAAWTSITAVAAASLGVLIWQWRRGTRPAQWLAGWFVSSIGVMVVIRTLFGRNVPDALTREAGALSIAGFAYAVVWETGRRIPRLPTATRAFSRPAPLLIYLGIVLLIAAASLFGLSSNLRFFQDVIILQEYKGAISLSIPLVLLAGVSAWPRFPAPARDRLVRAFLLGAVAGIPAFLIRAAAGPAIAYPATLLISSALVVYLVRSWADRQAPLPAAGVGVAAALGFAVSLWQRVLVDLLPPLFTMMASLGGIQPLRQWAVVIFEWSRVADWRLPDMLIYGGLSPALALIIALTASRSDWRALLTRGSVQR